MKLVGEEIDRLVSASKEIKLPRQSNLSPDTLARLTLTEDEQIETDLVPFQTLKIYH